MKAEICRADESREYSTAENCSILELANDASDPDVSIARARVKPGETTEWHWLEGIAERYVIVSGRGRVDISALVPA